MKTQINKAWGIETHVPMALGYKHIYQRLKESNTHIKDLGDTKTYFKGLGIQTHISKI